MSEPDHYGHVWADHHVIGEPAVICTRCSMPKLRGEDQLGCWPPCPDCGKPCVDHNDGPESDARFSGDYCWRKSVGECTGAPLIPADVRAAITAAILAERHRLAQALRARLGTVGGGALAVLREVIGAVEGSDDHR